MKKLAVFLTLVSFNAFSTDDSDAKITYVGLGRYACKGDSYKCAQIDANNRTLDAQRETRDRERMESDRERRPRDVELDTNPRNR